MLDWEFVLPKEEKRRLRGLTKTDLARTAYLLSALAAAIVGYCLVVRALN